MTSKKPAPNAGARMERILTIDREALLEPSPFKIEDHRPIGRDPRELGLATMEAG